MKRIGLIVVAVAVAMSGVTLAGVEARARSKLKGKILLTQKAPKKGADLSKHFKANATKVLSAKKGESKWQFHFYAVLKKTPPSNVVNIVFYQYLGGRYRYINAEDLKINSSGGGLIQVTGKYKIYRVLGFRRGKRYQMRLAVKNARGNEVVYARSSIILLK